MKAQKAKIKRNDSPKAQKLQNAAGVGADKICSKFIRKRAVFWQFAGGTQCEGKQKNERKWNPKGQNEKKWKPKRLKWKEMKVQKAKIKGNESQKGQNERETKTQKAKMKGNEGPKGQNESTWRPKRPKWKEITAQKAKKLQNAAGVGADKICLNFSRIRPVFGNLWGGPHVAAQANKKMKGNESQKAKMKGNEGPKG